MKNTKIIFWANTAMLSFFILFGAGCADLPDTQNLVPATSVEGVAEVDVENLVEDLIEEVETQAEPQVIEKSASVPAPVVTEEPEIIPTPAPQAVKPDPTPIPVPVVNDEPEVNLTPEPVVVPNTAPEETKTCCKYCKTSQACGDSCISKSYTCTKPPGCACNTY